MNKTPEETKKGLESCHESHVEGCIDCSKCPYGYVVKCKDVLHADALALIQQLEVAQLQWISVEDRLPETDDRVLCWYLSGDGKYYHVVGWYLRGKHGGTWNTDEDYNECGYGCVRVTHWMYLPPVPKEE